MAKSIKTNYLLNLINTGTQFLFPLITFPYATRIMGPDGIGVVNFYQSIISYVILIAGLGIPMYGIREIARVKDDKERLSQTTFEILLLHAGLTILAYVVIAMIAIYVPKINTNLSLFLLLSLSILFTTIGCDWFYKGIEDFKYITILGVVVKTLAVVFLFTFVKEKEDILWYGFYCVIGTLGGNLFNFFRLKKFVNIKSLVFNITNVLSHLKPVFQVFIFSVVTSLYLNMNPVILGFLKGDAAVGYYTSGLKLFTIATSISGSLGMVMLPRISYLIAEGKKNETSVLIQKAYDFSLGVSLPLCVFLVFASPYAIRLLCGTAFEPSIICAQVMSPIVIFLAISSLMGTQILYPLGEIKTINKYCAVGAIVDILLSFFLVPLFSELGTSIAYTSTEMTVMLLSVIASRRFVSIRFVNNNIRHYLIASFLLLLSLFAVSFLSFSSLVMLAIVCITSLFIYVGFLILVKDQIVDSALSIIKKK